MALPKFKWTEQTPGLANNWSKMWNKVKIQRVAGTLDAAGAARKNRAADWVDYIVGHDGNGVSAEITEPTPEDAILALEQSVKLTHKIKVRYDVRIQPGMQALYWFAGEYHKARIHTVTDPGFNQIWMILDAVEQTTQGSEYL
jgi:hypothetical protein